MPLDIFSRSKVRETAAEPSRIIIDFREKNSLVPSELARMGCKIEFRQLPIGDYLCGNCVVERKTFQDLQSCIVSKRIFSQMEGLMTQDRPILLVEGDISEWKLHRNVYRGFVMHAARKRMPLILSMNPRDTALYLLLMANSKSSSAFSFRPYKKIHSKEETARYVLEGFPGIGPATAKKLLEKFGSIRSIVNAHDEDLMRLLGQRYHQFMEAIS